MTSNNVPILLITFNRPTETKKIFNQIKNVQPEKLYVFSDGVRQGKNDQAKVDAIRTHIVSEVDWECELKTKFQQQNLGCKYGPQEAITWFFEAEPYGIILEDDCLPSTTFFSFSKTLLEKYKDDLRVFGISGTNLVPDFESNNNASYFFNQYFVTWGWATWRDRWQNHLNLIKDFKHYLDNNNLNFQIESKSALDQIVLNTRESIEEKIDAWDYLLVFSSFLSNGLIIVPKQNQVKNIGFGKNATHTFYGKKQYQIENQEISNTLIHPKEFIANKSYDNYLYNKFGWLNFRQKITNINFIKKYLFFLKLSFTNSLNGAQK